VFVSATSSAENCLGGEHARRHMSGFLSDSSQVQLFASINVAGDPHRAGRWLHSTSDWRVDKMFKMFNYCRVPDKGVGKQ
jgi:hypothetical protein